MKDYKKIYFIGIGGIGMSALAKLFFDFGVEVSGSDRTTSKMTEKLEGYGIKINYEHSFENITSDIDCVVYTLAIPDDNPEIQKSKDLNIPLFTYAQMLGEVSKNYFTIAVSGTHGKTTTTAMIADVFIQNNKKPNVIVGSLLKKYDSNYIKGDSDIFIVEACEYKKSFLNLHPNILVITNIDSDHLDFYKNLEGVQNAFSELIDKMPDDGVIVCDPNDPKVVPVLKNKKQKVIDYTSFKNLVPENILGDHNVLNASASLAVSDFYNLNQKESVKALENFEGTWRRFQCIGKTKEGALVYDDYAHHPTAVRATIKTLKTRFSDKKIIIIFHPHTYSRTNELFNEFVEVFNGVEEVILLPIYAAREENVWGVSSEKLVEGISKKQKCIFKPDFESVIEYLKNKQTEDYLIITMGAGDVYKITEKLV